MKSSKLIEVLSTYQKLHGDMDVHIGVDGYSTCELDTIIIYKKDEGDGLLMVLDTERYSE